MFDVVFQSQVAMNAVLQYTSSLTSPPELRSRMSELERNLSSQEKDIRGQTSRLQELQTQLDQSRRELVDRDRELAKTRHELTQATDKHQQSQAKVWLPLCYTDTIALQVMR